MSSTIESKSSQGISPLRDHAYKRTPTVSAPAWIGGAGFAGTYGAGALLGRHLYSLLRWLPMALGAVTLGLLTVGHVLWETAAMMIVWGAVNSAIPVSWSTWLTTGISDEPESGGGLIVAAIQLSILLGAAFGGGLLDHGSIAATMIGGSILLILASLVIGNGDRIKPPMTSGAGDYAVN